MHELAAAGHRYSPVANDSIVPPLRTSVCEPSASPIMAWWQKKLLKYALTRTGLLDDSTIDLDNLDVTFGRQNVFQFKDVGLNIKRISKLAQLPPSLRVETARVLSLRLTVPADIYQSSIVAEVDGVELNLRLEEQDEVLPKVGKSTPRSPVDARNPQHRKVHQRLRSPPPYDPGGLGGSDEHIPTTEEMAKSFLLDEPVPERRELEATVAAQAKGMEESVASESSSSESSEYGMGAAVGVPGFLAGFLQGILDRLQIKIKNIEASLMTEVPGEEAEAIPVTLRLRVGDVELGGTPSAHASGFGEQGVQQHGSRRIQFNQIALDLLSDTDIFAELSDLPSQSSPAASRQHPPSDMHDSLRTELNESPAGLPTSSTNLSAASAHKAAQAPASRDSMHASVSTTDFDRLANAGVEQFAAMTDSRDAELDIQPGDDNISWGSRRNKSNAPPQDLWNSMASEDDLPDSLLLDRAPTPRASSTRSGSPALTRNRRTISPYSRHLQSPGSWPRMEESHESIDARRSPGSWPNLEQSRFEVFESMDAKAITSNNLSSAIKVKETDQNTEFETTSERRTSQDSQAEDLTASRVFTHEEAESMFMSAMSHPPLQVPGGWNSDTASQPPSPPIERKSQLPPQRPPHSPGDQDDADDGLAYGEIPPEITRVRSGQATPRASSPTAVEASHASIAAAKPISTKPLLHTDYISIWLPLDSHGDEHISTAKPRPYSISDSFVPAGIPGTFSAYSESSASGLHTRSTVARDGSVVGSASDTASATTETANVQYTRGCEVEVGQLLCQFDVPSSRMLYRTALRAASVFETSDVNLPRDSTGSAPLGKTDVDLSMSIVKADFGFVENIPNGSLTATRPSGKLLSMNMRNVDYVSTSGDLDVRFGMLELLLGPHPLLRFDRTREMSSSIVISNTTPDVGLQVSNRATMRRAVKDIALETMPMDISLNLATFDENFSSFGGLSGILEAGNSMLSESSIASSPSSPKIKKGVRFEGQTLSGGYGTEIKFNGRIGGLSAVLHGENCSVRLLTTTLKTLYREQGAALTFEHAALSGPYFQGLDAKGEEPLAIDFLTTRLEYIPSPHEKDLDRLLSLLTPSKDKYDDDDDILIDTLLRQRKNGAVARVSIADVKVNIRDWEHLSMLQDLGQELSKLSAVTKYLPEDERPGLLNLIRVKNVEARLPVNKRFGKAHICLADIHCAHVGLPPLLAVSIGEVSVSQNGKVQLVHPLLPSEHLPMVMIRTLGSEMAPLIKIKLYNLCAEYSVPVLLAATGLNKSSGPDEVVAEMARSIADLALPDTEPVSQGTTGIGRSSDRTQKQTNIELMIHESALGLQPEKLSSKAMFVLSDALFSTAVPSHDTVSAQVRFRKAATFIADEVRSDSSGDALPPRGAPSNTATGAKLTAVLSQRGFVSVASIMSANIVVKAVESASGEGQAVDVDVKNELLLLETCADSTQTLIATLSGLAPPTQPSQQPKYLTEPMTIEDMMASFSGEPQVKENGPPSTLFDADMDVEDEADALLDMPDFEDDGDGLLAESEMESSLYGPISGTLEGVDKADDDDESAAYPETAESLLEDDPFEMPDTPSDARMGDDALVKELRKQCKPSTNDQSVELDSYDIDNLGFDALGTGNQQPLGGRHRFNTPASRKKTLNAPKAMELPLKVRLREFHIIWNLYDGYDWRRTREGITQAVEQVEQVAEERKAKRRQSHNDREEDESVIGDFLFNSIYIGVPSSRDAQELRKQINRGIDDLTSETESVPVSGMSRPTTAYSASGRPIRQGHRRRLKLERSRAHKVAFELKGVSADVLVFPPDNPDAVSSIEVRARDFEIFDNVPTSTWRKFLTHLESDPAAREMSKPMMHVEMLNVKTLERYAASEIVMHVNVQPIRLHVDQDALDFITRFFEFKDQSMEGSGPANDQPFLQRVEVETVDMCLDYKPKRVDYGGLRSGHYTEFKNFVILDGANIKLRHAIIYGIKGFEPLHQTLNDVWMPDIKRTQLPTVLAGLAPVRSLVNIGSGVRDVVAIPVREYKKDGRVVRSIQKGAMHFGKTTTSELARLGAKVAMGTQTYLTAAEGLLSPTSASPRPGSGRHVSSEQGWSDTAATGDESSEKPAISAYANQPLGVFSGLKSARRQLELDLLTAKDAFIAVQGEMMESATPGSAAAAVARHAPTVILRPVIGASRAVGTALLGVGNQIDRENVRKVEDVSVSPLWFPTRCALLTSRSEIQAALSELWALVTEAKRWRWWTAQTAL